MTMKMLMKENQNVGSYKKVIAQVKKNSHKMTAESMSDILDVDIEVVDTILENLDMDEEELAEILIDL